ncbi:hypothetical protein CEE45_04845 [Candidatus Heimdallarchaeota archaeon B3_Heim]|nr:MAG: hypothetical protein CEE45_04845 [Candidatus Heimdallarchaeota archaeon B3_Heim]
MSSGEEYLKKLLRSQELPRGLIKILQDTRDYFERIIGEGIGIPNLRFYYAGSYKKETMIKESFDLVIYYPTNTCFLVSDLFIQ